MENKGKKGREEGKRGKEEKKRKKWEKGKNWRRKVEREEKERREGWEAQRAVGLPHDTANVIGIFRNGTFTGPEGTQFSPLSSTPRKYHETQQKTTIWYPKINKTHQKHGKKRQNLVQNHQKSYKNKAKTTI